jgi:PncC family amidohydrolase
VDTTLEVTLGELLISRDFKLAVAESCTGGLISHRITNVPGSSVYYKGSVIAYAYETKVSILGVSWDLLQKYGAVSQEIVLEMARGVRKVLLVDIGLSVSGIAGPGGSTPTKPVGLTWIGLSTMQGDQAWRFVFEGDRLQNKEQAADAALRLLVQFLRSGHV